MTASLDTVRGLSPEIAADDFAAAILNILEDAAAERTLLANARNAALNVLEDAAGEKELITATQKAILNVLEDDADERQRLIGTQSAILNVLDDADGEKIHIQATQNAILNILADSANEQVRLAGTQNAVLNVLEDAEAEKSLIQSAQKAILNVLDDDSEERSRLVGTQRAMLNVLEDFDLKNSEIERLNHDMAVEIGERRRAEEALIAINKELEAFSYSVSHDLRAPLRSIDGFSQALMEDYADKLDADGKNNLMRIRAAALRMALLIDELLKLARISRVELRYTQVDLSTMARSIIDELREADPQRQVECIIPEGIAAYADSPSLHTVLENLLGNAWKYTGRTPLAKIEFGVRRDGEQLVYFVRDNGAGFDMAYAKKLFGVFQRLHSDKEFPGVGVGLAIVQRVIARHGGRISAEGAPEKGATFFFTLHDRGSEYGEETDPTG